MSEPHSVSELLNQLENDNSEAAHELWGRFIHRLLYAARRRLKNLPRRAVDEEDVAIAAFEAFFRGIKEQRFRRMENREDLWQVLTMLVERNAIAVIRRELATKRGAGLIRGESVFEKMMGESSALAGIDQVEDPNPVLVERFTQEVREKLGDLNDDLLQKIAVDKLEGYSNWEIADRHGIALRAVERKLQLIRQKWIAARSE